MKRATLMLTALALLLSGVGQASAGTILLTFNTPVPGTIQDANGLGTGFTTRLPGTGAALPTNDPNLNLLTNPGFLSITSTMSDVLPPQHFQNMEAVGLSMPGIGTANFSMSVMLRNIQVPTGSDQLMLYIGADANDFVRAGFHMGANGALPSLTIIGYNNGVQNGNGVGWNNTTSGIMDGDNVMLTLSRSGGLLTLSWADLTNPLLTGSSTALSFPWLNDFQDLYAGVYYTNPHDDIPRTSEIGSFSLTTATPEPASFTLLSIGITGIAGYGWRRRKLVAA